MKSVKNGPVKLCPPNKNRKYYLVVYKTKLCTAEYQVEDLEDAIHLVLDIMREYTRMIEGICKSVVIIPKKAHSVFYKK